MNPDEFDFAVVGATPAARLLAGLLASEHSRRVIHVGESQSGYRLPRGIDLSIAPMTRPDSWTLLRSGSAETLRILGRISGRSAWSHLDPILFADAPRGQEALSHIRQMMNGFGMAAEKAAPSLLGPGRQGILVRDAVRLNRPVLEPALDGWLGEMGVRQVMPSHLSVAMDGSARLALGVEQTLTAAQTILADDAAIISHLPLRQWPALLRRQKHVTILTTPTKPIAAPIMLQIDRGVGLLQQEEGGIAAWGPGGFAAFSEHLQALLGQDRQVEQAGQTAYDLLLTDDGAPVVGRAAGSGADLVAGFGPAGAFLMPALARWICACATESETAWFGTHLVDRSRKSFSVADYRPTLAEAVS